MKKTTIGPSTKSGEVIKRLKAQRFTAKPVHYSHITVGEPRITVKPPREDNVPSE